MTGTDIEVVQHAPVPDLVSSVSMYGQLATQIAYTEFVPQELRGRPEAALASMLYGRELGLGPMQSLNMIQSIKGRVGLKPEAMRGLVQSQGHRIWVEEQSNDSITMCGWRRGDPEGLVCRVTWSMADANRAGLAGNNWSKYPRAMLAARCTSELCRLHFPDVIGGLSYTPDELHDMPSIEAEVVEPNPTDPVDVKRAKGRLMDAIRNAGWEYVTEGPCPARDEAARLWGGRESIAVGELADLIGTVVPPPVDEVSSDTTGDHGDAEDGGGDSGEERVPEPPAAEPEVVEPEFKPGEEPFGEADQTLIGANAGRTLHVDLGRRGISKKADQEAFIKAASNGRTERASALTAEEAARCLFFADSVQEGRMSLADVRGAAKEMAE